MSKCDAQITKAAGKKSACKAKVHSKAYAKDAMPDAAALTKCETKFDATCAKAKDQADCVIQTQPCAAVENAVDSCVADFVANACDVVGGFCWFLGADNESCTAVCAAEGLVFDVATESYAGSGGSDANCAAVLDALGVPAGVVSVFSCITPIACYFDSNITTRARCTNAGTEGASFLTGQRACACKAP